MVIEQNWDHLTRPKDEGGVEKESGDIIKDMLATLEKIQKKVTYLEEKRNALPEGERPAADHLHFKNTKDELDEIDKRMDDTIHYFENERGS